jgi:hypothetical protein
MRNEKIEHACGTDGRGRAGARDADRDMMVM